MRLCLLALVAAGLVACTEPDGCGVTAQCLTLRSTASDIAGSWTEVRALRGISMRLSIAARDTTLIGTLTYDSIPSPPATTNLTGYVFWQGSENVPSGYAMPAHSEVVLNFAFADGSSAHFDQGVLQGRDTLFGVLTFSDAPFVAYGMSFVRAAR